MDITDEILEQAMIHFDSAGVVTDEFCEYLRKAGCVDMEVTEFIPGSLGRVIGKKPKQ